MKELTKTIAETKTGEMVKSWRQDVMECNNSGKRVSQWCKENGIALSTYYNRLRREIEIMLPENIGAEQLRAVVSALKRC